MKITSLTGLGWNLDLLTRQSHFWGATVGGQLTKVRGAFVEGGDRRHRIVFDLLTNSDLILVENSNSTTSS
jgi:hypothetical protein